MVVGVVVGSDDSDGVPLGAALLLGARLGSVLGLLLALGRLEGATLGFILILGKLDGTSLGMFEGNVVGVVEGSSEFEGDKLGNCVGAFVGDRVALVGVILVLGKLDGTSLGIFEGNVVGVVEGKKLGGLLGTPLGILLG